MTEPDKTTTYEYDAVGNRKRSVEELIVDTSGADVVEYTKKETSYTYSASNELTGLVEQRYSGTTFAGGTAVQYSYDPNGNQYMTLSAKLSEETAEAELGLVVGTAVGVEMTQAQFDVFGRMTSMTKTKDLETVTATYTYNGDGLRQSRAVTSESDTKTTNYLYDGSYVVQESGSATATYVRGMNYIAKIGASNSVSYYQYNAHGDVVGTTDSVGAAQNRYDYSAFGEEKETEETAENSLRYGGEFYDAELELYYQRARYYEPSTGRFLSEDTYTGAADNPATFNLYAFCNGDPVNYIDPSGHSTKPPAWMDWNDDSIIDTQRDRNYFDKNNDYIADWNQGIGSKADYGINTAQRQVYNEVIANKGIVSQTTISGLIEPALSEIAGSPEKVVEWAKIAGVSLARVKVKQSDLANDGYVIMYDQYTGRPHEFPEDRISYKDGKPYVSGAHIGTWVAGPDEVTIYSLKNGEQNVILNLVSGNRNLVLEIKDGKKYYYDSATGKTVEYSLDTLSYANGGGINNDLYVLVYIAENGVTNKTDYKTMLQPDGRGGYEYTEDGNKYMKENIEWFTELDKMGVKLTFVFTVGDSTEYTSEGYLVNMISKYMETLPNAEFQISTTNVEPNTLDMAMDEAKKFGEYMMGKGIYDPATGYLVSRDTSTGVMNNKLFKEKLASRFSGVYFNRETYATSTFYTEGKIHPTVQLMYAVSDLVHGEMREQAGHYLELTWAPCLPYQKPKQNNGTDGVSAESIGAYLANLQNLLNHGIVGYKENIYPLVDIAFMQPTLYFREDEVNKIRHNSSNIQGLEEALVLARNDINNNMAKVVNSVNDQVARLVDFTDTNTSGTRFAADFEMDTRLLWDNPEGWMLAGLALEYSYHFAGKGPNMIYAGRDDELLLLHEFIMYHVFKDNPNDILTSH